MLPPAIPGPIGVIALIKQRDPQSYGNVKAVPGVIDWKSFAVMRPPHEVIRLRPSNQLTFEKS
jgi:hypothetical protein